MHTFPATAVYALSATPTLLSILCMKTPALLPRKRTNFLSLQIVQVTAFSLVGYKPVRSFADNVYEAQVAVCGVLHEALRLGVGGEVERPWVGGEVCYAAGC